MSLEDTGDAPRASRAVGPVRAGGRPAAVGSIDAGPHDRRHRRHAGTPTDEDVPVYGALDLGTNNCRLLIARPSAEGFRVVDSYSRIVRLGEGLGRHGALSVRAMERAVAALDVCRRKLERRGVTRLRAVATEACRKATNREEFLARVRREAGIELEVISAREEARLAVIGCQSLLDPRFPRAVVFDIGGGSTEVVLVERAGDARLRLVGWASLPFGVITLTEKFGLGEGDADAYARTRAMVREALAAFEERHGFARHVEAGAMQLLGTSGTVTTLASVQLKLRRYDRRRVDGSWFDSGAMRALARRIALMDRAHRIAQPCIGRDRADYVVAGCAILESIFETWPVDRLRVADRGLREGVLRSMMEIGENVIVDLPGEAR